MCGIAGRIVWGQEARGTDPSALARAAERMRHHGPDGEGFHSERGENYALDLVHTRLSIIDLSEFGRQPMTNENGTVILVCNGEIYNFQELRSELHSRGHRFISRTDVETILHLYEELGEEAISRLDGMFALAIWDRTRRRLLLARDRMGVKPLYYAERPGGELLFASEVKALIPLGLEVQPDLEALAEHLTFQWCTGERCLFRGVRYLAQGHIVLSEDGRPLRRRQYYDLAHREDDYPTDKKKAAEKLLGLFEKAIGRQVFSDVPVGSFLSGGMDTGAISAVCRRHIPHLHTFTCGFDLSSGVTRMESFFDEREESRTLARYLDTDHHELVLRPGDMQPVLPLVVWHLDEPRVGISYQVWYTARLIKQYVTVVLSGVGGDESYAGYPWRYRHILDVHDTETFDRLYYKCWIRFLDDEEKRRLFTDEVNRAISGFSTFDSYREVMQGTRARHPLNRALYFDAKTFLNGLFMVDDKLSMAHSVESRVPFTDNALIDFSLRVPPWWKMRDNGEGADFKILLKEAMRPLLPEETLVRKKQGFTPPDRSWFLLPDTWSYLRGMLLSKRATERGYFKRSGIERILEEHASGKRNHRFLIWSLVCFEWWNRLFVDGETATNVESTPALSSHGAS
ncbi:MAG: asparagine synthase (glutamine-hydrolyzing) [Deltaproteobacteria bacterium]|nr:asparagine synthase (glutamine-hydrolyzing) [Deltaproteobacteria bacterium]